MRRSCAALYAAAALAACVLISAVVPARDAVAAAAPRFLFSAPAFAPRPAVRASTSLPAMMARPDAAEFSTAGVTVPVTDAPVANTQDAWERVSNAFRMGVPGNPNVGAPSVEPQSDQSTWSPLVLFSGLSAVAASLAWVWTFAHSSSIQTRRASPELEMAGVTVPLAPAVFVVPSPEALRRDGSTSSTNRVNFAKYHGLGNDFVIVDNRGASEPLLTPAEAQRLCDRNFGVGGDGVIFAMPPSKPEFDYDMRIYNSDGSEPEMCGNGIRCLAKFVAAQEKKKLGETVEMRVGTLAGEIRPTMQADGQISVDMGEPILDPEKVPCTLPPTQGGMVINGKVEALDRTFSATAVSMGNPHLLIFADGKGRGLKLDGQDMYSNFSKLGPALESHPAFPAKTNVEFCQVLSRNRVRMQVWERGAGPTLACGTGACATLVAGVLEGKLDRKATVLLPGGPLEIEWRESDNRVIMTGPADLTFGGELGINAIKEQTAALGKTDALGRQSEDRRVVHDAVAVGVPVGAGTAAKAAAAAEAPAAPAAPELAPPLPDGDVTVSMSGLPGAMGLEIAAACLRRPGFKLAPFALTGPNMPKKVEVDDGRGGAPVTVELYGPERLEELKERAAKYEKGKLVFIDFTHPSAVNGNAKFYGQNDFPFVMGTTGGDRDALEADTEASGVYAVIAPNMAKQIVAMQAAVEQMATDFPGAFSGYNLSVVESHQASKADTSGTAKAVSDSLAVLAGQSWRHEEITQVRDEDNQLAGGGPNHSGVSPVPAEALRGHAFHTYSLQSDDGAVEFQLRHNVCGRSTYAEGAVDAAGFIAQQIDGGAETKLFTMVDVLRSGAMVSAA